MATWMVFSMMLRNSVNPFFNIGELVYAMPMPTTKELTSAAITSRMAGMFS